MTAYFIALVNPTLSLNVGDISRMPVEESSLSSDKYDQIAAECVNISRADWDSCERSWDFRSVPLLGASSDSTPTLESSYTAWIVRNRDTIAEMRRFEEENNRLLIDAYGLQDELSPDVPIEQITLAVNPAYRYGGQLTEEEQWPASARTAWRSWSPTSSAV